jgi:hypothetical protein
VSGAGAKKSQVFAAVGDWDLTWTAKDTSGAGACYMGIIVYDAASNVPSGVAVNQQVSGQPSLRASCRSWSGVIDA